MLMKFQLFIAGHISKIDHYSQTNFNDEIFLFSLKSRCTKDSVQRLNYNSLNGYTFSYC